MTPQNVVERREEAAKAFHFFTDFTLDEATEFLRGYPIDALHDGEWD